MPKATWKNTVLAKSNECITVEGNQYFPADSINQDYFNESDQTSFCPWKGTASYYDIIVGDDTNPGAAWYYADPKPKAAHIKGYVAFWKGVDVTLDT